MGFALSKLQLKSPVFGPGESIPVKYTGDGESISPPLQWTDVPDGTRSFAILCHDTDAPLVADGAFGFVHWVLYNIPASVTGLPEGAVEYTSRVNGTGKQGYIIAMPPEGHVVHHSFFLLFALDGELDLAPGLTLRQLLERIDPHVIGMNRLVGVYRR